MPLSEEKKQDERKRIAQMVLDLVQSRGAEISYPMALAESGLSRSRFEDLFPDFDELFDAVAQIWLAAHMKAMEEVLGTDLPPNRKMYEFFRRRYVISRERFEQDPATFRLICEMGAANFERVRSYVDLADHYLCEIIVEAQADGYFAGLEIDAALSLINQMVSPYTMPDSLIYISPKLSEEKLARIIDTIFSGLSGEADGASGGVNTIRIAS